MPLILIKSRSKPTDGIPDGNSVDFQANNPALWKKLDGPLVRLGTSGKFQHFVQVPSLESIEAIKTTTTNMNWLLTPFLSADDLFLCTRALEKNTSLQELSHSLFAKSLKSLQAHSSGSARITHSSCFQVPKCTIATPDFESYTQTPLHVGK